MPHFKASDGLQLAYRVDDFTDPWQDTDTLIILHAAMGSLERLYAWVPTLCGNYRVVRPDLRGHGNSGIPGEGQLTLDRLTQDVFDLMDEIGVARAHLAGSSAGGIVAMYAAITNPERVQSLGAFAAIPGLKMSAGHTDYNAWINALRNDGVRDFLSRTIDERFNLDEVSADFVNWFLDDAARNDPELLARFVTLMSSVDFADRLGEIRCPTLLVVPGGDPNQSMEEYEFCRDSIGGATLIVYEGKRHNITDSDPERCAEDLLHFLQSQRQSSC